MQTEVNIKQAPCINQDLLAFFKGEIKNINVPDSKSSKAALIVMQLNKVKNLIEEYFEEN
jgi:N-dimethylarginine dimethylaminohydrolase